MSESGEQQSVKPQKTEKASEPVTRLASLMERAMEAQERVGGGENYITKAYHKGFDPKPVVLSVELDDIVKNNPFRILYVDPIAEDPDQRARFVNGWPKGEDIIVVEENKGKTTVRTPRDDELDLAERRLQRVIDLASET